MIRVNIVTNFKAKEDDKGLYVFYSDYIKEISKIKSKKMKSIVLCFSCSLNGRCNPHNNYGIIAIECNNYKQRKDLQSVT